MQLLCADVNTSILPIKAKQHRVGTRQQSFDGRYKESMFMVALSDEVVRVLVVCAATFR